MPAVTDFDLRLLRVFMTVVRSGGFSAAEATLNISQSTISNHMANLETRIGFRLCERGRSGFRLTDKGRAVYRAAERMFSAIDGFTAETQAQRGELTGKLTVGLVDGIASDPLHPIIGAIRLFGRRSHSVHLELVMDPPDRLEIGILEGRIDLAIGCFLRQVSGIEYDTLHREPQAFFCGQGHPLFDRSAEPIGLEAIHEHRIISRGYWHLGDVNQIGRRTSDATIGSMEGALLLVLTGQYLGFLPLHLAQAYVAAGRLRQLLPGQLGYESVFAVATRKGMIATPAALAFLKDINSTLRRTERDQQKRLKPAA